MPTDRGYVTITELQGGSYRVEIGAAPEVKPYAIHNGVTDVVVTASQPLVQDGRLRRSAGPLEVFVADDDGKLYVADIGKWPK
jgi:hypothetical protein